MGGAVIFKSFWLCFIALFVAIDPLGILPLFLSLTEPFGSEEKKRLALQASGTALLVGIVFEIGGHVLFSVLGITPADFRIAGGLLLLIISIREIFGISSRNTQGGAVDNFIGIVPLGIPLIAGPAMMTTLLILHEGYPFMVIAGALLANIVVTLLFLVNSGRIVRAVGEATSRGCAKVIAIFLAAIGIMMIRKGIEAIFLKIN